MCFNITIVCPTTGVTPVGESFRVWSPSFRVSGKTPMSVYISIKVVSPRLYVKVTSNVIPNNELFRNRFLIPLRKKRSPPKKEVSPTPFTLLSLPKTKIKDVHCTLRNHYYTLSKDSFSGTLRHIHTK